MGILLILCGANPPPKQAQKATAPEKQQAPREVPYAPHPDLNSDACYKSKNHDAADLCAQWRAAIAAEKAAKQAERATDWTIVATALSALALTALVYALRQTERSLKEARRGNLLAMRENARATRRAVAGAKETAEALEHARTSAAAGANLVAVSKETAFHQLRAYMEFDGVRFMRDPSRDHSGEVQTGISICIKNYGKTPARDLHVSVCYYLDPLEGEVVEFADPQEQRFEFIVPNDHGNYRSHFRAPNHAWEALSARLLKLRIQALVAYKDYVGNPHRLETTFESDGTEADFGFVSGSRKAD